jgi:hypothetical protein
MTEPSDSSIRTLVRKFRMQKTFEFKASITPDGADALATLIEALDARARAAQAVIATQRALVEKQEELQQTLIRGLAFVFGAGLVLGFVIARAAGWSRRCTA